MTHFLPTGGKGLAIKPPIVSLTYLLRRLKQTFIYAPSFYRKLCRRSFGKRFQRQECVHVWLWKEVLKGKGDKTQMGLIFNSVLVGLSFICKWIYTSNLADIAISIHGSQAVFCPHQHLAKADVSPQLFSQYHFCWHIPTQFLSLSHVLNSFFPSLKVPLHFLFF